MRSTTTASSSVESQLCSVACCTMSPDDDSESDSTFQHSALDSSSFPLLDLPAEVLLSITTHLPFYSHVYVSQTCRALYALYTEVRFKRLCQGEHFSRPSEHPLRAIGCVDPVPGWRALASGLVHHAERCVDWICYCRILPYVDDKG